MQLELYQVDAFADEPFSGNPAAVVPLVAWLDDALMQAIAAENNLAETAFLVRVPGDEVRYALRWFTPVVEVPLCGHATLAAGYVVLTTLEPGVDEVMFDTKSGELCVARGEGGALTMALPTDAPTQVEVSSEIFQALGVTPLEVFEGQYGFAMLESEAAVRGLIPDLRAVAELFPKRQKGCVGVTARADAGADYDFVCRFFGPGAGIDEDPVTGSAFCVLAPYWAARLGRNNVVGYQASPRGGMVACEVAGDTVTLTGHVRPYLKGIIEV